MFQCKACAAKDNHIASLDKRLDKAHDLFEKVVAPTYAPAIARQADMLMGGAGGEVEPEQVEVKKEMTAVERQALQLLTGTY